MNIAILFMGLIAILILVLGIFAAIKIRKQNALRDKYPGYPKGYWMSQGTGMGIALGAGVGVALENIAIGVAIGVALGAAIGSSLEKQHKHEIRPITDEEKELRQQAILFSIGTLLIGLILFVVIYLITR